jgi:hypothetical protein
MAGERTRLVSVAEDLYGKEQFHGFVKALRCLMRDLNAYPGQSPRGESFLFINEAGEAELASEEEVDKHWDDAYAGGNLLCFWKACAMGHTPTRILTGGLWSGRLGTSEATNVNIGVQKSLNGAVELAVSGLEEKDHVAAVGLLLALLGEDPGDSPGSRHTPPISATLDLVGLLGDAGKRVAEDLFGPLRFRVELVTYNQTRHKLSVVFKAA